MIALLDRHRDEDLVASGQAGVRRCADLLRDAAAIADRLPDPCAGSQVLLVFRHDRYAFAASLLAAWSRGHRAALPPNTRREAVWAIADRPETVLIVHDTGVGQGLSAPDCMQQPTAAVSASLPRPIFAAPHELVSVYTSGSTALPRVMRKTASQLLGESAVLVETFGLSPGELTLSTVPPGHIYGLLFSVLAPLMSGGLFLRETPFSAAAIAQRVAAMRAATLVTVPAHLRALAASEAPAFESLRRVFSSTAPLLQETAARFLQRHARGVTEIFGSSETGGIAWRDRSNGAAWTPLPGVTISTDEREQLLVDSPFIHPEAKRPYRTDDRVRLMPEGGFEHLGRSDGVIKVGGRRLSLPELEAAIMQLPRVEDAAVVAVTASEERGGLVLAAVVGADWNAQTLRQGLAGRFEHSCLPKRVLFVERLPREANGKLRRDRLLQLFGLRADGSPVSGELRFGPWQRRPDDSQQRHERRLQIPENYAWFEGHFPGYPILAAAVQLKEIVLPAIRDLRPELGAVAQMSRLKFLKRIKPADTLQLCVDWAEGSSEVAFCLRRGDTLCSSGSLSFAAEPS